MWSSLAVVSLLLLTTAKKKSTKKTDALLKVPPVTSSAGEDYVVLAFRVGKSAVSLRVEGNGEEDIFRVVHEECPAFASGAEQLILEVDLSRYPWNVEAQEEVCGLGCGFQVPALTYVELRFRKVAPEVSWRVRLQKHSKNQSTACWPKAKDEVYTGWASSDPGQATTEAFDVLVVADSHLLAPVYDPRLEKDEVKELKEVKKQTKAIFQHVMESAQMQCNEERTAFVLQMGDPFDLHGTRFFMPPMSDRSMSESCWGKTMVKNYAPYTAHCGPLHNVVGNWEGENACAGKLGTEHRLLAQQVRELHFPPTPGTGSLWYAKSYGPLLVVVLHALHNSPKCHALAGTELMPTDVKEGRETDFDLGIDQRAFLKNALQQSSHTFKMVALHHPLGGNAADEFNTWYGRGGAKAAKVGAQKKLHKLMKKYGVQILLHGHDHVFYDEVVSGIHYTCAGTVSAPWSFEKEGNYSMDEELLKAKYGYVTLRVSVVNTTHQQLNVMFRNHEGEHVGGYQVLGNRTRRGQM